MKEVCPNHIPEELLDPEKAELPFGFSRLYADGTTAAYYFHGPNKQIHTYMSGIGHHSESNLPDSIPTFEPEADSINKEQ